MGGRIQPRESENMYLYICFQYVHTEQNLQYTIPMGMLQLGRLPIALQVPSAPKIRSLQQGC